MVRDRRSDEGKGMGLVDKVLSFVQEEGRAPPPVLCPYSKGLICEQNTICIGCQVFVVFSHIQSIRRMRYFKIRKEYKKHESQ